MYYPQLYTYHAMKQTKVSSVQITLAALMIPTPMYSPMLPVGLASMHVVIIIGNNIIILLLSAFDLIDKDCTN